MVLIVILVVNLLAPIIALFFFLSEKEGLHFGPFVSIAITWLIGYYLLRIILWNTYGKEIIHLHPNSIKYIADYKWFKDSQKEFAPIPGSFEVTANSDIANQGMVRLLLSSSELEVQSALDISLEDFERIKDEIEGIAAKA